jgi:hypothetical protein
LDRKRLTIGWQADGSMSSSYVNGYTVRSYGRDVGKRFTTSAVDQTVRLQIKSK